MVHNIYFTEPSTIRRASNKKNTFVMTFNSIIYTILDVA